MPGKKKDRKTVASGRQALAGLAPASLPPPGPLREHHNLEPRARCFTVYPVLATHGLQHYVFGGYYFGAMEGHRAALDINQCAIFTERSDLGDGIERFRNPLVRVDRLRLATDTEALVWGVAEATDGAAGQPLPACPVKASAVGQKAPASLWWSVSNAPEYNTRGGQEQWLDQVEIMDKPRWAETELPGIVVNLATGEWGVMWQKSGSETRVLYKSITRRHWPHYSVLQGVFMLEPMSFMYNRAGLNMFFSTDGQHMDLGAVGTLWDEICGGDESDRVVAALEERDAPGGISVSITWGEESTYVPRTNLTACADQELSTMHSDGEDGAQEE